MQTIDLSKTPKGGSAMMLYGLYGVGKTFFGGSALQSEKGNGPCFFVNVGEQDGWAPLNGLGLDGVTGLSVESVADCNKLIDRWEKKPAHLIIFDGAYDLSLLAMHDAIGSDSRLPSAGDSKTNEWSKVHFKTARLFRRLKGCATYTIFTCPAERYIIPESNVVWIAPNLPGKQTREAVGWFDFVVYLQAKSKLTGVERRLIVAPQAEGSKERPGILTRQRLTREITEDILLPVGSGGYDVWKSAVAAATQGESSPIA